MPKFEIIAAVNNDQVLTENLLASPLVSTGRCQVCVERGFSSASAAYNAGLDATEADVVLFVHQDVYLPASWENNFAAGLSKIEQIDPDWGVIGVYGVGADGGNVGRTWSSGLGRELGGAFDHPLPVRSIDELVIIVNRRSGLRFDESLPGFHLYATDIALNAADKNLGVYVIHAPVVHNSVPVLSLGGAYAQAYSYLKRKWRHVLPVVTTVTTLSISGWSLWRTRLRLARAHGRNARRRRMELESEERTDPIQVATKLGYE
jgi:Glycosyltransferase like family